MYIRLNMYTNVCNFPRKFPYPYLLRKLHTAGVRNGMSVAFFFEFGPIKAYALQNMKDSVPVGMLGHVYLVLMTNCS